MAKPLDYGKVRREPAPTVKPTKMASPKQMRLWRNLAEELHLPAPPSQATMADAFHAIDRLLGIKRR